jgi:two-component system sensor histidine kinase AlgZ
MMTRYDFGASREPFSFILRNLAISSIISLVALRYFYVQHQWKKNIQAEARARLQALQARIHPHFLFNSLNTIASLIPHLPAQAEQATLDLAELFRFSLEQKDKIRLEEELNITRRYLAMESLRLGERLQVTWQLDTGLPMDELIPALILQPLVENAVYHGIQPLTTGGRVTISVATREDTLLFSVTNPRPSSRTAISRNGYRIAQDNIRQRLALAYGTQSALKVREAADHYSVSFAIPRKAKQAVMTKRKNTIARTVSV